MITKLLLLVSMLLLVQLSVFAQGEYPKINRLLGKYKAEKKFLNTEQVGYWLGIADPVAHQKFVSGQRTIRKGGIVAVTGGSIALVGAAIASVEGMGTLITLGAHEASLTGPIILLTGSAIAVPGFVVMIVGKSRKNRAVQQYNETISQRKTSAYFYQNLSPGRIAIGLRF
ncbi:hypothetical protein [Dyadobacter sp. Leaf189]|uniref:hypothetical protein n=1 Tax=Dyadobacter sp. Leaf189 TaxID=1736295 RepID=UPI0012F87D3D|nr:hypothetical protein [Dyadobacter sp. Leaf189]